MNEKEQEVADGHPIRPALEDMGVPFACTDGICGVCQVEVLEGEDNLTELTEQEAIMGMDKKSRLACQCKIKKGEVKVKY